MLQPYKYSTLLSTVLLVSVLSGQGQTPRPVPPAYAPDVKVNYVRTWEPQIPITDAGQLHIGTPIGQARMTTQYLDGLGRPFQQVIKQGAMATGSAPTDLVVPVQYDDFGREQFKYLPYPSSDNNGLFKLDPFGQQASFMQSHYAPQGETVYYGRTQYEPSPLNRVEKTMAPGNSWTGNNKGIENKYWINTAADEVRMWIVQEIAGSFGSYSTTTTYPAGELYKNVVMDEHGKQVMEFKDKEGKVILKKVQLTAAADDGSGRNHTGWLCTYYIYDDMGQQRAVIQPKGVELLAANGWNMGALNGDILNEQSFRYEYDGKPRMIMKKVPGAAPVYMVYDVRDRLVFTQDGNLRSQGKWLAILYDALNRPVMTGLIDYSGSLATLQAAVTQKTAASASAPSNGLSTDLTLNTTTSGTYQALRSITLETDFQSVDGGEFVAEITSGATNGATSIVEGIEVNNNPIPDGTALYVLTQTGYDNYDNLPAGLSSSLVNSGYGAHFLSTYNVAPDYAQEVKVSLGTKTRVTWVKTRILGTNQFLPSVNLYDDKGRVIQVQTINQVGAVDIATFQYDFSNKVLRKHLSHQNGSTRIEIAGRNSYDLIGRLILTEKNLNNSGWKKVSELQYDALGQLKTKKLAPDYNNGMGIENLSFDYNIRGWILGMNRPFIKDAGSSNYFGYELGYDKPNTIISGTTYNNMQYNGNVSGTIWKSKGDGEKRKYDYSYDATNRLLNAEFNQYTEGSFNKSAGVDFSMKMGDGVNPLTAYDANGNILALSHKGIKGLIGNADIDGLTYTYYSGTNKLQKVVDAYNDNQSKLGDFKYNGTNKGVEDYGYDVNGNLITDRNKKIGAVTGIDKTSMGGIQYNYLNLPEMITVKKDDGVSDKGTIVYSYDAAGNKLKKVVTDNTVSPAKITTTLYMGGFVYENEVLQFISHEEGRVRYQPAVGTNPASFQWDYFVKDHLGNVRMVLTEEQRTDSYPVASMETAQATTEEALYSNLPQTRTDKPASYPIDTYTSPNDKVAKVRGDGQKIGPAITLKVMAGDKVNIQAKSWYKLNSTTPNSPVNPLNDLLAALSNGIGSLSGKVTATELSSSGVLTPNAIAFLNSQNSYTTTKPKAFLNWILLDEQFKYVSASSGFEQVGTDGELKPHVKPELAITKNGYLYVFVSNETPNIDVFFDNLQVSHIRGPLLSEDHYYPFGLSMHGISTKAVGGMENKRKYQEYELNDNFDINLYESFYRSHDPQLGRFWQIDPKPNLSFSLYGAMRNNPILFSDPLGDTTINGQKFEPTSPENATVLSEVSVKGVRRKNLPSANGSSASIPFPEITSIVLDRNRSSYEKIKSLMAIGNRPLDPSVQRKLDGALLRNILANSILESLDRAFTAIEIVNIGTSWGKGSEAPLEIPVIGGVTQTIVNDLVRDMDEQLMEDMLSRGFVSFVRFMNSSAGRRSGLTGVYVSKDVMLTILQSGGLDLSVHKATRFIGEYPDNPNVYGQKFAYSIFFPKESKGNIKNFVVLPIGK